MNQSTEIDKLAAALSKAQAVIEGAEKDAENPAFSRPGRKSTYATLSSVWDACRAALAANELAVVQMPGDCLIDGPGSRMTLTTRLCHASGQWIEETMSIPIKEVGPHGAVGGITYARRAALAAFVGVAPADDDDGNEIAGKSVAVASSSPASPPKRTALLSVLQNREVVALTQLVEAGKADALVLKTDNPNRQFALEKLRVEIKAGPSDHSTVAGLTYWIERLEQFIREQKIPPPEFVA